MAKTEKGCKHWMQYLQVIWHENKTYPQEPVELTPVILTQNQNTLILPREHMLGKN